MQTVPRMADLFKEFLLKIASSQLKRPNLTESEGSVVVWYCNWVQNRAKPCVMFGCLLALRSVVSVCPA